MVHIPVLLQEVLENLEPKKGETIVDCNINRAGHSFEIAKRMGDSGTLIGFDLDTAALTEAQEKLSTLQEHPRILLLHDSFRNIDVALKEVGIEKVDKILFDLGLSSQELDISGRGFSFQKDEPLLMTYQTQITEDTLTAKDILNLWSEETLADIIYFYGGERFARRIAKNIVKRRTEKAFETTFDLVEVIKDSVPKALLHHKTNVATKTFQAIRIAVNDEIESLKEALASSFELLEEGGRIAVITFHSLEDKVVKDFFKQCVSEKKGELLHKKPVAPERDEIVQNPRARSSKLRTIIKL